MRSPHPSPSRRFRASVALISGFALFTSVGPAGAQADPPSARASETVSGWLRLRTTGYAFEEATRSGTKLDRFGAYQQFDGAVAGLFDGLATARFSGRFADDLSLVERTTTRSRLHVGYVELRPASALRARGGRQFLHTGATSLALDGVSVTARANRQMEANAWGGLRAPSDRSFEVGQDDDRGFGLGLILRPSHRGSVGVSYAYREEDGAITARPVAVDANASVVKGMSLRGRAVYDAEREEWIRAEAQGRWQCGPNSPVLSLQALDRRPSVDATSYFARFAEVERIRQGRASLRYERPNGFGGEAEYIGSFVDERTSARLELAALVPLGRIGYSARLGDTGEETGWFGHLGVRPVDWLFASAGASLVTYALFEDAPEDEERELITAFGALRLDLRPGLAAHLEVQSVENPSFSEDLRVLLGLDLVAGRGASRFGLDRGRFLQ